MRTLVAISTLIAAAYVGGIAADSVAPDPVDVTRALAAPAPAAVALGR